MAWRDVVIDTAWRSSPLWAGLKALHPPYTVARCRWRRLPTLRWVQVEVTNRCNLACTMCSGPLSRRPLGLMSREVFQETLRKIPDGSLHHLALISLGEPLLHPELELFASLARTKAPMLFTSTNGLLLGRDTALMRRLLVAGLNHIHFSAEGYDPRTYESVRIGGSFEEFLANLRLFRRVRDELGVAAHIDLCYTLVHPHTEEEIRRVFAVFGPHVDGIEFRPLNNQSHPAIAHRPQERAHGVRCFADTPVPCLALWCGLTVLWEGQIALCPRNHSTDFVAGDLAGSLQGAWLGPAATALRDAHARRRIPAACAHCSDPYSRTLAIVELDRTLQRIGTGAPA